MAVAVAIVANEVGVIRKASVSQTAATRSTVGGQSVRAYRIRIQRSIGHFHDLAYLRSAENVSGAADTVVRSGHCRRFGVTPPIAFNNQSVPKGLRTLNGPRRHSA